MQSSLQAFWTAYRDALRAHGSWDVYQRDKDWTDRAKLAAEVACETLQLQHSREYFRLDVCGYEYASTDHYDWNLRIAFEVENAANWKDELCKLSHVIADLRVLVAYELHKNWKAKDALETYVKQLRSRIFRIPDCRWLFIFGPDWRNPQDIWKAFSFDEREQITQLPDNNPLRGIDMGAPQLPS